MRILTLVVGMLALAGGLAVGAWSLVAAGGIGVLLVTVYQLSPTWRWRVEIEPSLLRVHGRGHNLPLELPWSLVAQIIYSPSTHTMFVDGGAPDRSLLVPGVGAPAPYAIENASALCRAIVAHVDAARVQVVLRLDQREDG